MRTAVPWKSTKSSRRSLPATFTAGVTETLSVIRSRARDWEIEYLDVVTAEIWIDRFITEGGKRPLTRIPSEQVAGVFTRCAVAA
jgi:hypothetical protein